MSVHDFRQLERLDSLGGAPENIFYNGSISTKRPDQSVITPFGVAVEMVIAANLENDQTILEPCAGQGGLLQEIVAQVERDKLSSKIYFNELDVVKKAKLKTTYDGKAQPIPALSSLSIDLGEINQFDRIIMNPPFPIAVDMAWNMLMHLKPGGRMVTLFPKYQLSRFTTNKDFILSLLSHSSVCIADVPGFDCGYGAKVCMITIQL